VQANLIPGQLHACAYWTRWSYSKTYRCGLNSYIKLTVLTPSTLFSLKHSMQGSHRYGLLFCISFPRRSIILKMSNSYKEFLDILFTWTLLERLLEFYSENIKPLILLLLLLLWRYCPRSLTLSLPNDIHPFWSVLGFQNH
jgi:hypothetical protein